MQTFKDKVILITGANRGIGKSLVKAALEKGALKIYATARDVTQMPDFADPRVVTVPLDITNTAQILKLAEQASDVQILINNAGSLHQGTIMEGDMIGMEYDMKTNYFGTVNMMRQFAAVLEQNAPSAILNIVSIVAYSPLPSIAGYSVSKAALFSATLSARIELAKKGITVQMVNPGAIATDMNKGSDWDMPAPDGVAEEILNKAEAGELDIIPDQIGQSMFEAWKEEPSKLADIFYKIYHGE
ncbi:SDR family NAD(P)-dependent oxidoreductase [Flavobacterium sp. 1355]|uniref:SDR family NAD(P)-dependent oxidoreductase n=1 Tax=Flavobacterium sp. 1355 TaxID=2806571 RepID=UPI001AE9D1A7|nr:SDR family NAD(P)-dependent oxidoreductase [Flavobacterium sp. 1355]MBP1225696.1 NAD(P)-dependent dehydrogenase (short-subunit alcohol dehydrogenase family) [Flavobacterium sp. 1355]